MKLRDSSIITPELVAVLVFFIAYNWLRAAQTELTAVHSPTTFPFFQFLNTDCHNLKNCFRSFAHQVNCKPIWAKLIKPMPYLKARGAGLPKIERHLYLIIVIDRRI